MRLGEAALVRVYAGRTIEYGSSGSVHRGEGGEGEQRRPNLFFSLLNFPMDAITMTDLLGEHPVDKAVKMLARALAVLHFEVGCDARDVEFVFGSPRPDITHQEENMFQLFGETVSMWLLDFNQVRPLEPLPSDNTSPPASISPPQTRSGCSLPWQVEWNKAAVDAYFDNDPYYPRPSQEREWRVFREEYLDAAKAAFCAEGSQWKGQELVEEQENGGLWMAEEFLSGAEMEDERRRERKRLDAAGLGWREGRDFEDEDV